jgi:hypothetical protein
VGTRMCTHVGAAKMSSWWQRCRSSETHEQSATVPLSRALSSASA